MLTLKIKNNHHVHADVASFKISPKNIVSFTFFFDAKTKKKLVRVKIHFKLNQLLCDSCPIKSSFLDIRKWLCQWFGRKPRQQIKRCRGLRNPRSTIDAALRVWEGRDNIRFNV